MGSDLPAAIFHLARKLEFSTSGIPHVSESLPTHLRCAVDFSLTERPSQQRQAVFFELRLARFLILRICVLRNGRPVHLHQASGRIEMNGAAVLFLRHTPAVWQFHRHQQGIARFQAHALAAYFGNELARQDVKPLILLVMHVKRSAAIWVMVSRRKHKDGTAPLGVGRTNDLGVEHPLRRGRALIGTVGCAAETGPHQYRLSGSSLFWYLIRFKWRWQCGRRLEGGLCESESCANCKKVSAIHAHLVDQTTTTSPIPSSPPQS